MSQIITYICGTHSEYPRRINWNNMFYSEYKNKRPFFFHEILSDKKSTWSETLKPTIDDFKDKFSYITQDYILNSLHFEYCDYYISSDDDNYTGVMLPINPYGPTGLGGRGLLGKWGPNLAADPIVITYDFSRSVYQLLVIERKDTPGIYALPGGMKDSDECISQTVIRELKEETNVILDSNNAILIYSGYVNDPRNTDHSWLETSVYLFVLNSEQRYNLLELMEAGDDAMSVTLIDIDENNKKYTNLYSNHKEFVDIAMEKINTY